MDQVTRRFLVFGKVQGVYFRHSARLEAKRRGLRGIARNLPDGSVEVLAHGGTAAVEEVRETAVRDGEPVPEGFAVF
jgi:acylphosphatase